MPEKVFYCNKIKSVCVDSFGKVSFEDVEQSIKACNQLFEKHLTKNLIVDVSKQEVAMNFLETFNVCNKELPKLPNDLKVAYIINDPPQQPHRFFKLISDGMGFPIKLFFNVEGALKWLNEGDDQASYPFIGKVKFPSSSLSEFE